MDLVQSLYGCGSVHERVLSLTWKMFSMQVSPAVIFVKLKTPAFMAFRFDRSSQGLCGVRAVFCRDLSDCREWEAAELHQNGNLSD